MGQIRKRQPVKLVIGFIFKEDPVLNKTKILLRRQFGKVDFESQIMPFNHTDYYEKEMGRDLRRCFISFEKLILPETLPNIKILTNKIEGRLLDKGMRLINIDPGYLDHSKFILASTKDYKHRIYLNKGIYAEITLFYQDKSFRPWEWTYPDYRSSAYIDIFNQIRNIYVKQIEEI